MIRFLIQNSPIIWLVFGIALMLFLNIKCKLNSMVALLIVAILVGILEGLPLDKVVGSIKNGFGGTLGTLAIIVAFGSVLGKFMVDSGAAQRIATTVINKFGVKYVQWGILLIGFLFGISMFYEVAFMILAPLIISIAIEAKVPYLRLGIAMVAAATTAHSTFPPQPGSVALISAYHADMGMVYILGIIVVIPTIIASGIILPKFLGNLEHPIPPLLKKPKEFTEEEMPKFWVSLIVPLIPAIIISSATIIKVWIDPKSMLFKILSFFGSAEISMLIAVIVGIYVFGIKLNKKMPEIMQSFSSAIEGVSMIILIMGSGGAFKQIILDTGLGKYITVLMQNSSASPLIMAWAITVLLRLATGTGAVSAITAAGIVGPLVGTFHINPALMVLATAAGSNTLSHLNDAAFWLFKGYFNLSIKDTFKTWGLLELTNSVVQLCMVLVLSIFIS